LTPVTPDQPGIAIYKVQAAKVIASQSIRATFAENGRRGRRADFR